jgi:hypothetical protein
MRSITVVAFIVTTMISSTSAANDDEAALAARSIVSAQLPSGFLTYDFDFTAGASSGQDHIVRQAGVLSFLAEYYLRTGDTAVRGPLEKGLETLWRSSVPITETRTVAALGGIGLLSLPRGHRVTERTLNALGLLYDPRGNGRLVARNGEYSDAWAGATAVALMAELWYREATSENRFRAAREAWVTGLLALHIPRHGFRATATLTASSPFSDGEGWLAFAYYHRLYPENEAIRRVLSSLDRYLMDRYADEVTTGFYQWGTMAAAVRLNMTSNRRFLTFITTQTERFLSSGRLEKAGDENTCSDVEGLATALGVLRTNPGSRDLARRLEDTIRREMDKNRSLQIQVNSDRVRVGRDAYLVSPHLRTFAGAFLEGRAKPYTRIDYTGHCLSAMVKLRALR